LVHGVIIQSVFPTKWAATKQAKRDKSWSEVKFKEQFGIYS